MTETAFADLRARVADTLDDPTSPLLSDVAVLPDVVDSLTPPAWLLTWGDPWMVPATFCTHTVRLDVVCIAGRIDPAPGIATIEEMVAVALSRLRAAGLPEATVLPPARYDIGGVPYLAARISIDARIAVPLPEIAPTSDGAAQLVANAVLSATGATSSFAVKSGAAALTVTATLTATGATGAYPTSTATATLSTTGTLTATGATAAWPRQSGAASLATTPTLAATGAMVAGFTPAALPGLVGWWDASDLATITSSGSPTRVSQWANKAGAVHATQSTGSRQPITGTRTLNGLNVLDFTGTASGQEVLLLATDPAAGATAGTMFHVAALDNVGDGGGVTGGWGASGAGAHFPYADTNIYETFGSTAQASVGNPGQPYATAHVYSVVSAASDYRVYLDGTSIYTTATNTVGWNSAPPRIGAADAASGAFFYDGRIAELIVCNVALSTTQRTDCQAYLHAKWGTP